MLCKNVKKSKKIIKIKNRQGNMIMIYDYEWIHFYLCYLFPKESFFLQQMQNSVMLFLIALQSPTIHEWCKWGRGKRLEHMTSRCWAMRVMWEMWVVVVCPLYPYDFLSSLYCLFQKVSKSSKIIYFLKIHKKMWNQKGYCCRVLFFYKTRKKNWTRG